jgi:D-xylose transport system substrate-binding protein
MEVLKAAMDAGKIKNVGEAYTDGWKPEAAQKNMEQFLTANDNKVDGVVSSNDGMAGGVVAALKHRASQARFLFRVRTATRPL